MSMNCESAEENANSTNLDSTLNDCIDNFKKNEFRRRASSITTIGNRLKKRRELHIRRKICADLCLGFAVLGIFVMIISLELRFSKIGSMAISLQLIQLLLSILTIILVAILITYHVTDLKVFMIDNSLSDFRVAISYKRLGQVCLEIFICLLHPANYGSGQNANMTMMNDILGMGMFLKLYLVGRVMVLHSWINQNLWTQSLGTMNKINFNFRFVLKSAMNLYPVSIILFLIVILLCWCSWAVRVCEIERPDGIFLMKNSMWLISITFLGVGYGDIVPLTTCGRIVAVMSGIFGAGITALTVAILAKKLEFTNSESYVHYFIISSKLNKSLRIAAANIVKRAWKLYKIKAIIRSSMSMYDRSKGESILCCERKLFQAIYAIRDIKRGLKQVSDESVVMCDVKKINLNLQNNIYDLKDRVASIENIMNEISLNIKTLMQINKVKNK